MSRRSGRLARAALSMLLVAGAATPAQAATQGAATPAQAATQGAAIPAQAAAPACDAKQSLESPARPLAGSTPVLFVHGLASNPEIWANPSVVPITRQVGELDGVSAWTFDYSANSVDWVTDPRIGKRLAETITCLALAAGRPVIVVAHSMGGLATQYAVAQTGSDGVAVATHVAKVITIGTPFTGSLMLSLYEEFQARGLDAAKTLAGRYLPKGLPDLVVATMLAARSYCAGKTVRKPAFADTSCGFWSLPLTPAGKALHYRSPEITALPKWPPALPVLATASNIYQEIGAGTLLRIGKSLGDFPVSLDSGTAYKTLGTFVVTCSDGSLADLFQDPCYHSNLPHHPQIVAMIVAEIRGYTSTTSDMPYAGANPNGWPVLGPDGRVWFNAIEKAPHGEQVRALDPRTGAIQAYPVNATPTAGTYLNYTGAVAFDGRGDLWLAAEEKKQGRLDVVKVLIRFDPVTGATARFEMPQRCSSVPNGAVQLYSQTDGAIWLYCVSSLVGGHRIFRVIPNGRITPVPQPDYFEMVGKPAPGPDGEMWTLATHNSLFGWAKFGPAGFIELHPDSLTVRHTGIVGNGTGVLFGLIKCARPVPGEICFASVAPDGTPTPLGSVTNITAIGDLSMDQYGNVSAVVTVGKSSPASQGILRVTRSGTPTITPFRVVFNGRQLTLTPFGPPLVTADRVLWSGIKSGALLKVGPL